MPPKRGGLAQAKLGASALKSCAKQTAPLVKNPTSAEKDNVLKLINQKRYQEAEPLARHLTIKYPHDVFGWRALGWALRELGREDDEIGRASCRERVCQYVSISVVAVSLKKKIKQSM